jgi:hypothetical protein
MKIDTFSKAQQAYMDIYVKELDIRMQRSQLLGSATSDGSRAALFFDRQDGKFTLLVKDDNSVESTLYDSIQRVQWERNIMLFGHSTRSGGYIAAGHGTLNRGTIAVKLSSKHLFFIEVDPNLPCLAPYVVEEAPQRRSKFKTASTRAPQSNANRNYSHIRANGRNKFASHSSYPENNANSAPSFDGESDDDDFSAEDLARLRGEIAMPSRPRF